MLSLSPVTAFLFSLRFVAGNFGPILGRIAIPALLGVAAFYVLLTAYLYQIDVYLDRPSGGNASRILGMAAVGVLVMLFLHSQLVSAVAGLLMQNRTGSFLGIRTNEWRLFVSSLQLVLIICAYGCVIWAANRLGGWLDLSPLADAIVKLGLLVLLFRVLVRSWFFLLPLCASTGEGEVLLRSWTASRGHVWKITGLVFLVALVVLLFHLVLQFLLWIFDAVPPLPGTLSISGALDIHRALLLPFVMLLSGTYLPAAILTTVARIRLYQELTGSADQRHEG